MKGCGLTQPEGRGPPVQWRGWGDCPKRTWGQAHIWRLSKIGICNSLMIWALFSRESANLALVSCVGQGEF